MADLDALVRQHLSPLYEEHAEALVALLRNDGARGILFGDEMSTEVLLRFAGQIPEAADHRHQAHLAPLFVLLHFSLDAEKIPAMKDKKLAHVGSSDDALLPQAAIRPEQFLAEVLSRVALSHLDQALAIAFPGDFHEHVDATGKNEIHRAPLGSFVIQCLSGSHAQERGLCTDHLEVLPMEALERKDDVPDVGRYSLCDFHTLCRLLPEQVEACRSDRVHTRLGGTLHDAVTGNACVTCIAVLEFDRGRGKARGPIVGVPLRRQRLLSDMVPIRIARRPLRLAVFSSFVLCISISVFVSLLLVVVFGFRCRGREVYFGPPFLLRRILRPSSSTPNDEEHSRLLLFMADQPPRGPEDQAEDAAEPDQLVLGQLPEWKDGQKAEAAVNKDAMQLHGVFKAPLCGTPCENPVVQLEFAFVGERSLNPSKDCKSLSRSRLCAEGGALGDLNADSASELRTHQGFSFCQAEKGHFVLTGRSSTNPSKKRG
eukprot:scaffold680_cov264-Pinguiococcus_pyrenoidosus.AAC.11